MTRLIDADALKESLTETLHRCDEWIQNAKDGEIRTIAESNYTAFLESILRVKEAPTIDAVPVIRCKDCVHKSEYGYCTLYLNFHHLTENMDYCSDAERKEE